MQYDMPLYRPPSEARSLILQVTLGCSWNRCLFCGMYKGKEYQLRAWEDLKADIDEVSLTANRRIFLADGDVLGVETGYLLQVLSYLRARFPDVKRISSYAGPTNLALKSEAELSQIKAAGLEMLYIGLETGNEALLRRIKKGTSRERFIEGCQKAKAAGMRLSTIILLGLGGVEGSAEHARDSASMVSAIDPDYLACLTLMLGPYREIYEQELMGDGFKLPDKRQSLLELQRFVVGLELTDCRFGTEHASNYLPIGGQLPRDKAKVLQLIERALNDSGYLRPEWARGL